MSKVTGLVILRLRYMYFQVSAIVLTFTNMNHKLRCGRGMAAKATQCVNQANILIIVKC